MAGVYRGVSAAAVGAALTLLLMPASAGATFSGDNGLIAFEDGHVGGIYTIEADGSDREHLTGGYEPSWSPSGKRIVFVKGTGPLDDTEVFTMKPSGSHKTRVTDDGKYEWEPAYSPDRKRIAFRTGKFRGSLGTLWVMDADGSHRKKVGEGRNPDWSVPLTDEQKGLIAFSNADAPAPCGGGIETFTMSPKGEEQTLLPFGCVSSEMPSWSSDGFNMAVSRYVPPGAADIALGDPTDSAAAGTQLTDMTGYEYDPAWSPEGDVIAFGHDGDGLWLVDPTSPLIETAIPNTAEVNGARPDWQPK